MKQPDRRKAARIVVSVEVDKHSPTDWGDSHLERKTFVFEPTASLREVLEAAYPAPTFFTKPKDTRRKITTSADENSIPDVEVSLRSENGDTSDPFDEGKSS